MQPRLVRSLLAATLLVSSGCGSSEDPNSVSDLASTPERGKGGDTADSPKTPEEQARQVLESRKTDYGEALRTASLKLRDALPSLEEIKQIEAASDDAAKKVAYEKLVDKMLADPAFAGVMVKFFKDTFRTGQVGAVPADGPNKDAAANFAAQVVVEGRSYKELFTATSNTCPTYDSATGSFTPAACPAGPAGGATVGVLTDPGLLAQYFANMGFRRARFVQEVFACSKFPSEYSKSPVPLGSGTYTNPRKFDDITGKKNNPNARIDFQDTSSVICANCHGTLNAQAPLFINYDDKGFLQGTPQVEVPVPNTPKVTLDDFMPAGKRVFAWRIDKPVANLTEFGAAIANDPDVAQCAVNRIWNYAFSRGDIVTDIATIPGNITETLTKEFDQNGQKLKETIRSVFKHEDFVKF